MTIVETDLEAAARRRRDELLGSELDRRIELLLANYQRVTADPHKMGKLRGILRHYAKMEHPWRQCVADNTKRFGPDRAKAVCSVVKDTIRQSTDWRGHPGRDHGSPGVVMAERGTEEFAAVAEANGIEIDGDIMIVLEDIASRCNPYRVIIGLDEPPTFEEATAA